MIAQNGDKNTEQKNNDKRKILFVCTGNTCRSPMAQYYFNGEIAKLGKSGEITAESCGLCADDGIDMSQNAIKVLELNDIIVWDGVLDVPPHKSRQINGEIVREADMIYGITVHHEARLKEQFPEFQDKISHMPENIGDPYGGSLEVYERCFENIKRAVDIIIKSL